MELEPQYDRQLVMSPELRRQREKALQAIGDAVVALRSYRDAHEKKSPSGSGWKEDDELKRIFEDELLPTFLGAPGEVCETCGGSGRK
jgi:hypothetical protein